MLLVNGIIEELVEGNPEDFFLPTRIGHLRWPRPHLPIQGMSKDVIRVIELDDDTRLNLDLQVSLVIGSYHYKKHLGIV